MQITHLVRVLVASTETVLLLGEKLNVGSAALETLLELDLVLNDKRLALGVDGLGEEGRDGMVSCLGF